MSRSARPATPLRHAASRPLLPLPSLRPWEPEPECVPEPDPRRWAILAVLCLCLLMIVLDNTILNVAVPTIIREFHSSVSSLQWVISGYSLVFASLLISFGRLGDIFGRRKLFFLGAGLFAVGSLIASLSGSVVELFIGESLLEGVGAAMMLPATLSILSATFHGRERGVAFAVWGSVAGGATGGISGATRTSSAGKGPVPAGGGGGMTGMPTLVSVIGPCGGREGREGPAPACGGLRWLPSLLSSVVPLCPGVSGGAGACGRGARAWWWGSQG